jgi:hypothetical protein
LVTAHAVLRKGGMRYITRLSCQQHSACENQGDRVQLLMS